MTDDEGWDRIHSIKRADPDETEGRRLYRARADALAKAQVVYGKRRVKPIKSVDNDPGRLVPPHGSGPDNQ